MRKFPAKNGWQDALQKLREENAGLKKQIAALTEKLLEKERIIIEQADWGKCREEYLGQIAALKAELSDKSWRLRDPYGAFLHDAAKKDNCRNCVHMRPATLPSAVDRISCKYAEGWPHWSTRCNKWEKIEALRGEEVKDVEATNL